MHAKQTTLTQECQEVLLIVIYVAVQDKIFLLRNNCLPCLGNDLEAFVRCFDISIRLALLQ